jgi:CubicO group peptidase (beta-lactamase class C family)
MTNVASWTLRLRELAEQTGVPGAVLGIWADGKETLAAAGVLNVATGVETTPDSLFQIGSITKLWTTAILMQLKEENQINIITAVADVLPDTRIGSKDIGHEVTVADLLSHTSGLDGDIFSDTGRGDDCLRRYVADLADAASAFPVGAGYSYCNAGFVLAGRMVEVLDGRIWDESLRDRLIAPLGLTKTVTLPEEALLHRTAVGHDEGEPVRTWGLPRCIGPAGTINASAHDLLTFARVHLDGGVSPEGKRILSRESVSLVQRPRVRIPTFAEPDSAVGLGWRTSRWGGHRIIGHDGGTIGQSAFLRVAPEAGVAVCLLTNTNQAAALYRELFDEVFQSVAGITMPPDPAPVEGGPAATADSFKRYVGRYERIARRYDVSIVNGELHVTAITIGSLGALIGPTEDEATLYPADESGKNFVCRLRDNDPWTPLTFGELAEGTPYIFASGRIALRIS